MKAVQFTVVYCVVCYWTSLSLTDADPTKVRFILRLPDNRSIDLTNTGYANYFQKDSEIILIIHGWGENVERAWIDHLSNAYYSRTDQNFRVVIVDWANEAYPHYMYVIKYIHNIEKCSHQRSVAFWTEGIREKSFIGIKCDSWEKFEEGLCNKSHRLDFSQDRYSIKRTEFGYYYSKTNSKEPFLQATTMSSKHSNSEKSKLETSTSAHDTYSQETMEKVMILPASDDIVRDTPTNIFTTNFPNTDLMDSLDLRETTIVPYLSNIGQFNFHPLNDGRFRAASENVRDQDLLQEPNTYHPENEHLDYGWGAPNMSLINTKLYRSISEECVNCMNDNDENGKIMSRGQIKNYLNELDSLFSDQISDSNFQKIDDTRNIATVLDFHVPERAPTIYDYFQSSIQPQLFEKYLAEQINKTSTSIITTNCV